MSDTQKINWNAYRERMESIIKVDDMTIEDSVFMATHMPISNVEIIRGGNHTAESYCTMTEDEVYNNFVVNTQNEHRLIIVRGDAGTGKSHLIRFLKNRFENDTTNYNSETEQIVFLRRMNNSIKGAFQQLLDEHIIKNEAFCEKIRKFINAADSKDEGEFKTEILHSFVALVKNDTSKAYYKPGTCMDCAQFLLDKRVTEHLLRTDGAIDRCYRAITSTSNTTLDYDTFFTKDDFTFKRNVINEIIDKASDEANNFFDKIQDGDFDEMDKLVKYINSLTSQVIKECAGISSENAKSMFIELRQELKKQGKNLTLFIEDFTGFTGIDTEMIVVLSTAHGGEYDNLCRVTSVIGLTDSFYYNHFADNLEDRVTYQVHITKRAFGDTDFLISMTARYLNAIYCDKRVLEEWYVNGSPANEIPIADFRPPCVWEHVDITANRRITLYPFNRNAIQALYNEIANEVTKPATPRRFLQEVLKVQLRNYFDGKQYGDWIFPAPKSNKNAMLPSQTMESLKKYNVASDAPRISAVLNLWGNKTVNVSSDDKDGVQIGGVPQAFFADIGIHQFDMIPSGDEASRPDEGDNEPQVDDEPTTQVPPITISPEEKRRKEQKDKFIDDIAGWYIDNKTLMYDYDYRNWLANIIFDFIDWNAADIPVALAKDRVKQEIIFIENQLREPLKTLIKLDKSEETKAVLEALVYSRFNSSKTVDWTFNGAQFYLVNLVAWIEKNKSSIVDAVRSGLDNKAIFNIVLATKYNALTMLNTMPTGKTPFDIGEKLIKTKVSFSGDKIRTTVERDQLMEFAKNKEADFNTISDKLDNYLKAFMGDKGGIARIYRTDILIDSVEYLIGKNWDISDEVSLYQNKTSSFIENTGYLLNQIYGKLTKVTGADEGFIRHLEYSITGYIPEIDNDSILELISGFKELNQTLEANSIHEMPYDIVMYFGGIPKELSEKICKAYDALNKAESSNSCEERFVIYSSEAVKVYIEFEAVLRKLQNVVNGLEKNAKREQAKISNTVIPANEQQVISKKIDELMVNAQNMEVYDAR